MHVYVVYVCTWLTEIFQLSSFNILRKFKIEREKSDKIEEITFTLKFEERHNSFSTYPVKLQVKRFILSRSLQNNKPRRLDLVPAFETLDALARSRRR